MIVVLLLDLYAYLRRNLLPRLLCTLSLLPCTCASAQVTPASAPVPQRLQAPVDGGPPSLFAGLPSTSPLIRQQAPASPRTAAPEAATTPVAIAQSDSPAPAALPCTTSHQPAQTQAPCCCACPPHHGPSLLAKVTFALVVLGGLFALVIAGARS